MFVKYAMLVNVLCAQDWFSMQMNVVSAHPYENVVFLELSRQV